MKKRYNWSESRIDRLFQMKETGHRTYCQIARKLGCTVKEARRKYAVEAGLIS